MWVILWKQWRTIEGNKPFTFTLKEHITCNLWSNSLSFCQATSDSRFLVWKIFYECNLRYYAVPWENNTLKALYSPPFSTVEGDEHMSRGRGMENSLEYVITSVIWSLKNNSGLLIYSCSWETQIYWLSVSAASVSKSYGLRAWDFRSYMQTTRHKKFACSWETTISSQPTRS